MARLKGYRNRCFMHHAADTLWTGAGEPFGRSAGEVLVKVRLIYRRAYRALADQKGWQIATGGRLDILMEEEELQVN